MLRTHQVLDRLGVVEDCPPVEAAVPTSTAATTPRRDVEVRPPFVIPPPTAARTARRGVEVRPPVEFVVPTSTAPRTARRAIESLRVGLPSLDGGTRQLAVGFRETERLINRFLRDIDADGGGAMVLKGSYGQGKTFALKVLEEIAGECGFITTRMEIDATENRLSKPLHIFRNLMRNLRLPDVDGPGVRALASKTNELLAEENRGNAAQRERWLNTMLGCFPLAWLLSDPDMPQKPRLLGILEYDPNYPVTAARMHHVHQVGAKVWPPVIYGTQGDFAAYVLSGIGRLARILGYKGFLIILDEMEKWTELNWADQSRAGNLLGGLIWGATAEEGRRGWNDHPRLLEHSRWCGGYPFTTEQRAHIGVAIAMTPRDEAADPEAIWCQYGTILIGDVPRFTNEELIAYSLAVVPLFARAYGIEFPSTVECDAIAADALCIWRRHGDLTTRSGVQAVIAAFDKWRDHKYFHFPQSSCQ